MQTSSAVAATSGGRVCSRETFKSNEKRHSVALSGTQRHSEALSGSQWQSVAISGHQRSSVVISRHQWQSDATLNNNAIAAPPITPISVEPMKMRQKLPTACSKSTKATPLDCAPSKPSWTTVLKSTCNRS